MRSIAQHNKSMSLLLLLATLLGIPSAFCQEATIKPDILGSAENTQRAAIERQIAKQLQILQKQAHVRVMGRLPVSERNKRLACTLAWTGELKENEGTRIGIVSFVSATPEADLALQKLVKFPDWEEGNGEYSFHHFDVAVWPMRDTAHKGSFAVRIEMRQGLYYDWADSHITDDSLNKNWWRSLVAPQCR